MPAVALTPPYSILAKKQGYRDLVKTSDIITVSPTTGLVTTKEKLEKEPGKIRRVIRAVFRAVDYAKTRKPDMIQFITRQYKMERDVAESVYDAIMETLSSIAAAANCLFANNSATFSYGVDLPSSC